MTDIHTDDFLDVEPHAAVPVADELTSATPRRQVPAAAVTAGWLVAGLAVGAVSIGVWEHHSGTASAASTPAAGPGGLQGGGPGADEQHLTGTLGSVSGSTFALTTNSGTTSYTIDSDTMLVKDGQRVASLTSMHTGDQVVVHVYQLNGKPHVERVLDGEPAGGFGGPPTGVTTTS